MKLIDILSSSEFNFLVFLSKEFEEVLYRHEKVILSRDSKLGTLLSNKEDLDFVSNTDKKIKSIQKKINSLNIKKLSNEKLQIIKGLIEELKMVISVQAKNKGVDIYGDDDLPF